MPSDHPINRNESRWMNEKKWMVFLAIGAVLIGMPSNAMAMHITEGILPLPWAGFWFFVAIPFVAFGLRELNQRSRDIPHFKPMVGLVGAAVFVISCMPIPVPTAGTCAHPCGTGMAAILIGPLLTVVVTSIALLLQALFLSHGGLTTLGGNIVSMGLAGGFVGFGVYWLAKRCGASLFVAAFLAGVFSDWATYATTSLELASALHSHGAFGTMFWSILLSFCPTQIPLGILEGFLTAGAVSFVYARRPEILGMGAPLKGAAR